MAALGKLRVAALSTLVLAELGCTPVCDQEGLRRAAVAFDAHSVEAREEGFHRLFGACPSLPPTLGKGLVAELGEVSADLRATIYLDRPEDPVWRELFEQTCPRTPEERDRAHAAADRDRAARATCKIDRYELLAPDDGFVDRDLVPFMLYEWLLTGHVERPLAADVVRPLLSANAPPEELEAMCLRNGTACQRVLEHWNLHPPRSNIEGFSRDRPQVFITPSQLSVESTPLFALVSGRPTTDAFVRHAAGPLRAALVPQFEEELARVGSYGSGPQVRIAADHATPFSTIADTFFTAVKAGYHGAELVVLEEHGLAGLPVGAPRSWFRPDPHAEPRRNALQLVFTVHRDSVEASGKSLGPAVFPRPGACLPPPAGCHDLEAITAFATDVKMKYFDEIEATFRVDGDVPLQAVVSLIDAVRGGGHCSSYADRREIPSDCLFTHPIIDAEPPLHFRADRPGTFALGEAAVHWSPERRPDDRLERELLDAYATARRDLAGCFAEHPEITWVLDGGEALYLMIGHASDDPERTTARVFLDGLVEDEDLERCILASLRVEPDRRARALEFLHDLRVELVIPTRFEPRD